MDKFVIDYLLGGVAGAISKTITAPLDRVKLVYQCQNMDPEIKRGEVPRYKGVIDCATRIYTTQGISGFWKGNTVSCLRYFPTHLVNLFSKDKIKRMFPKYSAKTEFSKFFLVNLASGGLAASCSLAIVYPMDYFLLLVGGLEGFVEKRFEGFGDFVKKLISSGGIGALYSGIGVSMVGIVIYRAVQLATFDTITSLNPWRQDEGLIGMLSSFLAAQTAITVGAFTTYPCDTVRRRLQMDAVVPIEEQAYKGSLDCANKIFAEEGLAGFYNGFYVNCCRSILGGLVLISYSRFKAMFFF